MKTKHIVIGLLIAGAAVGGVLLYQKNRFSLERMDALTNQVIYRSGGKEQSAVLTPTNAFVTGKYTIVGIFSGNKLTSVQAKKDGQVIDQL